MKKLISFFLLVVILAASNEAVANEITNDTFERATIEAELVLIQDQCVKGGFMKREGPSAEQKFRDHLNRLREAGHPNIAPEGFPVVDVDTAFKALDFVQAHTLEHPFKVDQAACDDNQKLWPLAKQYGAE